MSPRASRFGRRLHLKGRARVALATCLSAVLAVGLAGIGSVGVAPAATAATDAGPPGSAALTVDSFAPEVAKPGQTLELGGTIRGGAETLAASVVHVRVSTTPVSLRDQLAAIASERVSPLSVRFAGESAPVDLPAGGTRAWSVRGALNNLGLRTPGAYPVFIDLDSAVTGITVSRTVTFLSWFPTGSVGQPTHVVWTVPLVGSPARNADGIFINDRTASALAPGGRLRTLLDAVAGTSATWIIDPELLDAARDMADGYQVRNEEGKVESGGAAGAAAAQSFLAVARRDLATADVASLGYADPDVNGLQRAGLSEDTVLATNIGPPIAAAVLGRRVRANLAWPPGDSAERATLSTLRAAGIRSVILADTSLPVDPTVPYTPTGLARITTPSGSVNAVLADTTLSSVVGAPDAAGGPKLARARYLAETLVITEQRPSDPRTIVVAPPRLWDVGATFAHDIITTSTRVPWLHAATLDDLLSKPLPDATRGPLTVPPAAQKTELSADQTNGARKLGGAITTFTDVLNDPAATKARYRAAQLRIVSGAFRTQRAAGRELLDAVALNLARDHAKVRVLSRGTVTLSGANGQVPITVANDLDQSVVVRVRLVPSSAVRLRIEQPDEIRLGPHLKETIEVSARAATGGTVPVEVSLFTRTGSRYSEPVVIQVRSTVYSRVALAIVVLAALALLVLVAARLARRLRRNRATV